MKNLIIILIISSFLFLGTNCEESNRNLRRQLQDVDLVEEKFQELNLERNYLELQVGIIYATWEYQKRVLQTIIAPPELVNAVNQMVQYIQNITKELDEKENDMRIYISKVKSELSKYPLQSEIENQREELLKILYHERYYNIRNPQNEAQLEFYNRQFRYVSKLNDNLNMIKKYFDY